MLELIINFLIQKKIDFATLLPKERDAVIKNSKDYLLIGYVMEVFNFSDQKVLNTMRNLKKNFLLKNMLMHSDLDKVTKGLREANIDFCILKGAAIDKTKAYKRGIRFYRDIDILVAPKDLEKSFLVLQKLGYQYLNKLCKNSCRVLGNMHHLPVMSNQNKTFIELHHRVTMQKFYSECPLSNDILETKIESGNFFIPCPEAMLAHFTYHGLIHNTKTIGPTFLFDIHQILNNCNINYGLLEKFIEKLQLKNEMTQIESFFDELKNPLDKNEINNELDKIKLNLDIRSDDKKINFLNLRKLLNVANMNFFHEKIGFTECKYQVSKSKAIFPIYYILELLETFRRNIRFH